MATALHRLRLEAVTHTLLASGARHVADLGCGCGELLQCLREHDQCNRLIGIDIDAAALAHARNRLMLDLLQPDERLQVSLGSFEETDWATMDIDAAVLLETIEHIDPGRLSRVERALFGRIMPALVFITTPNRECNSLHGLAPGARRHPGHRFEWTRAQFRAWCGGVAERHGYGVCYRDIGPSDRVYGSSTQMACFKRVATRQPG
ncbi:MAG: methyltransferase domain-containing protein [Gammaproteobacteria bacterium]|nr:methyltransferase domain-containing protein [Gammaproteobacteria bacterium]